ARHDAVLDGEQRHQQQIDNEGFGNRPGRPAVDRLRHRKSSDERNRVNECAEEQDVSNSSVEEGENACHFSNLLCSSERAVPPALRRLSELRAVQKAQAACRPTRYAVSLMCSTISALTSAACVNGPMWPAPVTMFSRALGNSDSSVSAMIRVG